MEELELICFQIISHAGTAKSNYIEAMSRAREGDFKRASELINEGVEEYRKAHKAHSSLITEEADGNKVEVGLLLMHAEDQLITTEVIKLMAEENIQLIKEIRNIDE